MQAWPQPVSSESELVHRYVVVVEKDAVFQRLVDDEFPALADCILVNAKGMPDIATRAFVRAMLEAVPHLKPVARAPQAVQQCLH